MHIKIIHQQSCTHLEITSHVPFCKVSSHQMQKNVHTTACGHPLTLKPKTAIMDPTLLLHYLSLLASESWMLFPRSNCPEDRYRCELLDDSWVSERANVLNHCLQDTLPLVLPRESGWLAFKSWSTTHKLCNMEHVHNLSVPLFPY